MYSVSCHQRRNSGTGLAVSRPMKQVIHVLAVMAAFSICPALLAQSSPTGREWTHLSATPADKVGAARWVQPLRGELFRLDHAVILGKFAAIKTGEPSVAQTLGTEIELPMPDGTTARFAIVEAPVMAPELAAKFPEIKTYAGQGIDDPSATIRLDLSPAGFHAQVLSPNGTVYVDPAYRGDANHHVSYYKRDHVKQFNDFECLAAAGKGVVTGAGGSGSVVVANKIQSGATLRTYRLAVACTGEYAAFFGGTTNAAMTAIVAAVNRVDGVYETELAVRLVLVANNNALIFLNSATDPYTNTDGGAMLTQNQTTVDSLIGGANYDIGHVFSTGGGGVAYLGVVCNASSKAGGVTGSGAPTGDAFWIDYVAHEMGHQFGGNHTFNAVTGSCGGGNRNAPTAFEPGSGLTIMAYAGICSPNNLQPNSDPYFHAGSLDEIQTFLNGSGGGCASNSATGNGAPVVSVVGPTNYTIPASTPFILTATGSDPNGDPLTYCWEEMDAGASAALTDPDNGSMALFRNILPNSSPVRFLPKLTSVLANTNWNQEKLPTTSRTMKFRVTARDNRSGGGGVADAEMLVTSVVGTGPFVVTSPNTATNWSGARTVTWNVAGTASAPISASGVDIYLSTNGGIAFPFLLVSNVANSGSSVVVLPNLNSSQARIKVQGTASIFYDVSDANFTVAPGSPVPLVQLQSTTLLTESCTPTNGTVDPYETVTVNWTLSNAGTAPTTNLVATLLTSNGVYYPSAAQNYGAIASGGNVTRSFAFTPAGTCGGSVTGVVKLLDGTADMGTFSKVFTLGTSLTTVSTQVFQNVSSITINDATTATPYPSAITVSGVTNSVGKLTAKLNSMTHTYPSDVAVLLVNPVNTNAKLMGRCGGGFGIVSVNLTFDDSQPALTSGQIISGSYHPTIISDNTMTAPAPVGPYGTTLAPLATNPNGTWNLYVQDVAGGDVGSIAGGWSLTFVTSNSVASCCNSYPAPTLTSTTISNNAIFFSWMTLPGLQYQVQSRTNLALGTWANYGAPFAGTGGLLTTNNLATGTSESYYRVSVGP